jgi:hypothetical protein
LCLPEALLYQINMKYYVKTWITETGIAGVGTRDAGTSEFSNLKTRTLKTGSTGGFSLKTCNLCLLHKEKFFRLLKFPLKFGSRPKTDLVDQKLF